MGAMTNLPVYDEVVATLGFSLESIREDSVNARQRNGVTVQPKTKRQRHKLIVAQNKIMESASTGA